MTAGARHLLLGAGNLLRRDEGLGVHVVRLLGARRLPPTVELFDAGTAGLDAAPVLENRALVVVADAIDAGVAPGTIFRLPASRLRPAGPRRLSLHQTHLLDALAEAELRGRRPRKVVFYAVQAADTSTGIGLSAPVAAAAERVAELMLAELPERAAATGRRRGTGCAENERA